jgi:tetratricopeptide (TPR) repeat protein
MGQVITFYSYKGGTGRTMALANTACLLAKSLPSGEEVLAIDWDLEAPGLHHFFERPEGSDRQPGVIDMILELQGLLDKNESLGKDSDAVADLIAAFDFDRFILSTQVPNVRFMPAGAFDDEYENRVVSFNWPAFYEKAPSALLALADFLATRYRYVLIDSRTGLSDLTGLCTMILPEKLVTVFTPSHQSLDGLVGVVRRALAYRGQSPDLRPLGVFPLPSRIELAETDLRTSWRIGDDTGLVGYQPLFESLFRELYELPECSLQNYFDDVQIQHVPRYAYGERIAVLIETEPDRLSLTRSYQAFVSRLERLDVPWDGLAVDGLVPQAEADDEAERSYHESAKLYAEVGDISNQVATLTKLAGHRLRRGFKDEADQIIAAAKALVDSLETTPSTIRLLLNMGDLLLRVEPGQALAIYNEAYEAASEESSLENEALWRRGEAYFMLFQFHDAVRDYSGVIERLKHSPQGRAQIGSFQAHHAKANLEIGRYDAAKQLFSDLLERSVASNDEFGAVEALVGLASAKLGKGDIDGALENIYKADEICERLRQPNPDLWLVLARIASRKGEFDQADTLITQAIEEYRKVGDKRAIATALRHSGDFRAARQIKAS